MSAAAYIAEIYRTLRADADPFRLAWAGLDSRGRGLLVRLAGIGSSYADAEWDAIPADFRGRIKARAADMKRWLNETLPDEVTA